MWLRRIMVVVFTLAIAVRLIHCLYIDALLPSLAVQAAMAEFPPLQNPNDSNPNETCCICKGAIVPPLVTAEAAGLTSPLPSQIAGIIAAEQPAVTLRPDIGRPLAQYLLGPPPLGGKTLRAMTHLLLI
jgi:hypothetical protein